MNRVEMYLDVLCELLEDYQNDHPDWQGENLVWLMTLGLDVLREEMASGNHKGCAWPNPFITWPFPVKWDWTAWKRKDKDGAGIVYDAITLENTRTKRMAIKTISKIMVEHLAISTLQDFTHGVGYEHRGDTYHPILSPEAGEDIAEARTLAEKRKLLKAFLEPFSIGGTKYSVSQADLKEGRKPQASPIEGRMDLPAFNFEFDIDGHKIWGAYSLQIHPLVIRTGKKEAFYPITCGISLLPCASSVQDVVRLTKESWANPSNWRGDEREELWSGLKTALMSLKEEYSIPVSVEQRIDFSGQIALNGSAAQNARSRAAVEQILAAFQGHGDIVQLTYNCSNGDGAPTTESRLKLVDMLGRVERARTPADKGTTLEELIAAMLSIVPGFTVKQRVHTSTEELDLVVLNESAEVRWRNDKPLILVECKNWSSSCGKNELIQFRDKLRNRRGRSSLGFLISWNGFAETVTKELLRDSHEENLVVPIDGSEIENAARTGKVLELLQTVWDKAVMI